MRLINRIFDVFAPYECLNCGREGSLLCESCSLEPNLAIPSRCYRCKKLTTDFAVCDSCRRTSSLKHVWVSTEYSGIPKELVSSLKFKSARPAAPIIASFLAETLPILPSETIVVHVPTATSRIRIRGFDHAKLIASYLAKDIKLEHQHLVTRVGQTRQVGAKRKSRLEQLTDSYYVKQVLDGQRILLVDDIVTTGATLEAAAKALKVAGTKQVDAVVFAQK